MCPEYRVTYLSGRTVVFGKLRRLPATADLHPQGGMQIIQVVENVRSAALNSFPVSSSNMDPRTHSLSSFSTILRTPFLVLFRVSPRRRPVCTLLRRWPQAALSATAPC